MNTVETTPTLPRDHLTTTTTTTTKTTTALPNEDEKSIPFYGGDG